MVVMQNVVRSAKSLKLQPAFLSMTGIRIIFYHTGVQDIECKHAVCYNGMPSRMLGPFPIHCIYFFLSVCCLMDANDFQFLSAHQEQ